MFPAETADIHEIGLLMTGGGTPDGSDSATAATPGVPGGAS
jgi:hypothetical protein